MDLWEMFGRCPCAGYARFGPATAVCSLLIPRFLVHYQRLYWRDPISPSRRPESGAGSSATQSFPSFASNPFIQYKAPGIAYSGATRAHVSE